MEAEKSGFKKEVGRLRIGSGKETSEGHYSLGGKTTSNEDSLDRRARVAPRKNEAHDLVLKDYHALTGGDEETATSRGGRKKELTATDRR